jgi:hypothetical protein
MEKKHCQGCAAAEDGAQSRVVHVKFQSTEDDYAIFEVSRLLYGLEEPALVGRNLRVDEGAMGPVRPSAGVLKRCRAGAGHLECSAGLCLGRRDHRVYTDLLPDDQHLQTL